MDALQRIADVGRKTVDTTWGTEDFRRAAIEGVSRWRAAQAAIGIKYHLLQDAALALGADEQLSENEVAAIKSARERGHTCGLFASAFLRWHRCAKTRELPNPYEPWIALCEHGASFSKEHGFLDVYDHEGTHIAGLVINPHSAALSGARFQQDGTLP